MVVIEIQVSARTRESVCRIHRAKRSCHVLIGNEADTNRVSCTRHWRNSLRRSCTCKADGIRRLDPGSERAVRSVTVVSRGHESCSEIRAGEAWSGNALSRLAHHRDTKAIHIGCKGVTVRDRPATNQVIDQTRCTVGSAIQLIDDDIAVLAQALTAESRDTRRIILSESVKVDAAVVRCVTNQITNSEFHSAAFIDVRSHVKRVLTASNRYRIQCRCSISGSGTIDRDGTTLEGDRVACLDTDWIWRARGIQTKVIPEKRSVVQSQPSGAGDRTRIAKLELATTNGGRTRVGVGVGQRRGISTNAIESDGTRDLATKGGVTSLT